ncbi:heparan-alpha-glucosaminide N-acetyltransferase domain-containing protein [Streptomyces polychromogenes]|uniref:Heparan-alpha-glucosaminide N-acetyltransferase domain-containing protein n=1 Tax=Streptomyces polychromogenes TaxID=67342 RepID=A0ABP3FLJ5_9ACTN
MTRIQSPQGMQAADENPPARPPASPSPAGTASAGPSTGRLVGVDLARALAVFGMYIVHIGPVLSATHGVGTWVRYLADGHSSVLFATLAGFSLMLIAGRREPKTGLAGRQAKARIAIRAVVLLALGTVLAMEYGGVIILGFYGVYFLLALPLLRLRAGTLAAIAAGLALVTPQLAFVLNSLLSESVQQGINAHDPLKGLSEVGMLDLLLTGFYPTITWMSFVVAGMALARLDLSAATVRRRLAGLGAALTASAYGLSLLLAGTDALRSRAEDGKSSSGSGAASSAGESLGSHGGASDLLSAGPHTGTTFDVIGSVGVAILVIVGATVLMDRLPRLRRLAGPVIAVGTMSLTAYVGHFLVQSLLGVPAGESTQTSWVPVLLFILGAIVFAALWSRFFRRGPLEALLNAATRPAQYLR